MQQLVHGLVRERASDIERDVHWVCQVPVENRLKDSRPWSAIGRQILRGGEHERHMGDQKWPTRRVTVKMDHALMPLALSREDVGIARKLPAQHAPSGMWDFLLGQGFRHQGIEVVGNDRVPTREYAGPAARDPLRRS